MYHHRGAAISHSSPQTPSVTVTRPLHANDQSRALARTVFVSNCNNMRSNVPVPSLHISNPPISSTLMPRGCDRDSCASNSAGRRESMQRPRTVEHLHPRVVAHKHLAVRIQDAHGGSISRSNTAGARAERQRIGFVTAAAGDNASTKPSPLMHCCRFTFT